jgi:hypothetical protein
MRQDPWFESRAIRLRRLRAQKWDGGYDKTQSELAHYLESVAQADLH